MKNHLHRHLMAAAAVLLVFSSCGMRARLGDQVGVYIWGALPPGEDPLVAAVEDAQSLGAHVVRICLAPYWDPRPGAPDRLVPLGQRMKRSDYRSVFQAFPVVMITAYDSASYDTRYRKRSTMRAEEWTMMLAEVKEEFRLFAMELARLPNTFVISNWEAENDSMDDTWDDYLAYLQTRLDGIVEGRKEARQLGYPARISTAVEFKFVAPGWTDPRLPILPRTACGLSGALSLSGVDYLAYSSWESIYYTPNRDYTPAKLREAFATIRQKCQTSGNPCRIIVSEAGYLRDWDPDNSNLNAILIECQKAQAAYVINWNAYDQPGQADSYGFNVDQSRFGKFDLNRNITSQGEFLQHYLRQKSPIRSPWASLLGY